MIFKRVVSFCALALFMVGLVAAGETSADASGLRRLDPPASVRGDEVDHGSEESVAILLVENESGRTIGEMVVRMLFLDEDGQLVKTVPHTALSFPPTPDLSVLEAGEVFEISVKEVFLEDEVASVEGLITEIVFEDGRRWPELPDGPIVRQSGTPVGLEFVGYLAAHSVTRAVIACQNHGEKDVRQVLYRVTYSDRNGEELTTTGYTWGSWPPDNPLLRPGEIKTLHGGQGPPEGAVKARAFPVSVDFFDGEPWRIEGYPGGSGESRE